MVMRIVIVIIDEDGNDGNDDDDGDDFTSRLWRSHLVIGRPMNNVFEFQRRFGHLRIL